MDDYSIDLERRDYLKLSGAVGLAGLAGCVNPPQSEENKHHGQNEHGKHHEHSNDHYSEPQPHAEVEMYTEGQEYHFSPHVAWVEEGGTVTWHNKSGAHTTTAYSEDNDTVQRIPDDAESWDSGLLTEKDATYEHTFEEAGVYDYFCSPHEGKGMLGSIIVGTPDTHHSPALEPPQDTLPDTAQEKIRELNAMVEDRLGADQGHDGDSGSHSH
ncbi:MAG: plastocyanin/azurin family copper-binding protein [Candidatus Nanohaloarchaea archaeon]|nr:plastocyanin/azurin family copper-binding protein [Candidatus Nanohaloarchaea archaeon]